MAKIKTKKKITATPESFPYDEFETEAISRFQNGESLVGSEGILTGLIQRIVNAALSATTAATSWRTTSFEIRAGWLEDGGEGLGGKRKD